MRTLFVAYRFPEISAMFIANTAAGLLDAGCEVDILALSGPGDPECLNAAGVARGLNSRMRIVDGAGMGLADRLRTAPGRALAVARRQGLRAVASAFNPLAHRNRLLNMRPIHEIAAFNHFPKPDVIHCQFATVAEPFLRMREAGGLDCAIVAHFRGHDVEPFVRSGGLADLQHLWREADALISNSGFFREQLIGYGCPPDRIRVVESPVDVDNFPYTPPRLPTGRPVQLLTVARLVEKKGICYALEAVALLRGRGQDVRYRIIGGGELMEPLNAQASALGIADIVSFLGPRPHTEVAAELAAADLFVAPSITDSHGECDAAINTLKEAMLTGRPLVSTWHGGIPELVEDGRTGHLVPERDAPALADRLGRLIADPAGWPALAEAARAAAEHRFDMAFIARQTLAVYQDAIAHRAARGRAVAARQSAAPAGAAR
jgi:colanic acid/amylovoran biosynthesis glycosyltransferase